MQKQQFDSKNFFQLKPLKIARVSEISEATASSAVAPEERVNFHIGNPVQDKRLMSAYLRIVLGIDIKQEELDGEDLEKILQQVEWSEEDKSLLDFLKRIIQRSCPYSPRGGFSRDLPNELVNLFTAWLQNQQEPLLYDLGQVSGKREIVLSTGGTNETLRILYHALSSYILFAPAYVFLWKYDAPEEAEIFSGLRFRRISESERTIQVELKNFFSEHSAAPAFLVIGDKVEEETRRILRNISLTHPLFFIEANDAPNYCSLAREAKLVHNVIRLLSPAIFSKKFRNLATTFVVGNADILSAFEAVHFQLKGSPSASETELLTYLIKNQSVSVPSPATGTNISVDPPFDGISLTGFAGKALATYANSFEKHLSEVIVYHTKVLDKGLNSITSIADNFGKKFELNHFTDIADRFLNLDTKEFMNEFFRNLDSPAWQEELKKSFLNSFLKHHPEYRFKNCIVVSGSARTALGLLGFHCNIREVVVPDLSWSYEQCFPSIKAVPLTSDFELDVPALINAVEKNIISSPDWKQYGAVAINNPHNATGRIFKESDIRALIIWLLERNIYVIDDLSYQDVAPTDKSITIKTVRQLAQELVYSGRITEKQADKVISVHSVSKTDCLAGARLAVIEIRDEVLYQRFLQNTKFIVHNIGAIALTYLFYRSDKEVVRSYWQLRNRIFYERSTALVNAVEKLPSERNPFQIKIIQPTGSMYPLLVIERLPAGLSLEWLSYGLAHQGIGMLPLSTFAHTKKGFETARKTFRLTLGGTDGGEILYKKTRRVLIDLNRLIAEESSRYNRKKLPVSSSSYHLSEIDQIASVRWNKVEKELFELGKKIKFKKNSEFNTHENLDAFKNTYLPQRIELFRQRFKDRWLIAEELLLRAKADGGKELTRLLEKELYKDSLSRREEEFHKRFCDRTVHPTQKYSIHTEVCFNKIIRCLIEHQDVSRELIQTTINELLREYLALNVAINSTEESHEVILDLDTLIDSENYSMLFTNDNVKTFLSFWGDWDGSNRPSGQTHRLVATTLIENVTRLARLLTLLAKADSNIKIEQTLQAEVQKLEENNLRFTQLLNDITELTHKLEKRYRGILPFNVKPGRMRNVGMKLHLARDPLTLLWHHNDRLERKMFELRTKRRQTMEYYFSLNKQLRKQLYTLIPAFSNHLDNRELMLAACLYRDLLQRLVITPRIHQRMITSQDPFASDTTVYNIHEINEIGSRYGNPGLILALQISMSTKADALIALDRKMRARREQTLREHPNIDVPSILLIPLFEDLESVRMIPAYLNKIWDYALQSRRVDQEVKNRFAEIIPEIFIAGSDLSQAIGQSSGYMAFQQAKGEIILWLAQRGLNEHVRVKMGCGEPMQRQGGYYAPVSGVQAFESTTVAQKIIAEQLPESAQKSAEYATTPLMGVFVGGDLKTFQSSLSENLRYLPTQELMQVIYHVKISQQNHRKEILRVSESLMESRLKFKDRGTKEIERITIGSKDQVYDQFSNLVTENFRQILYGLESDVVGLHIASYFIGRAIPQLRDRPTVRPDSRTDSERGQKILERISQTIPLARHGSMLRAIAHNQSQTVVLGINQLTTGLFRALNMFSQMEFKDGTGRALIADRILPRLPVYEILQTLRLYHDVDLYYLKKIEPAFPAGNSAFLALREDNDSLQEFISLFQQELMRRHGIDISRFFEGGIFNPKLLPSVRPDLAVILQRNIFNTNIESFLEGVQETIDHQWRASVEQLLDIRRQIQTWRSKIWLLLQEPIFQQVKSFTELAVALNTLTTSKPLTGVTLSSRGFKPSATLSQFFQASSADDEMRQFLAATIEYLSSLTEGMVEVPVTIVRAMKDVEKIAKIEEETLPADKQALLRFYILQIARLTGENS